MKKIFLFIIVFSIFQFSDILKAKPYYCTKALLMCTDKCIHTFLSPNLIAACEVGCLIGYSSCGEND